MSRLIIALIAMLLLLAACEAESSPDTTGSPVSVPVSQPTGTAQTGEAVEITVGTDTGTANEFDPVEVAVPAGATVQLTFENRSSSVAHNLTFGEPISAATSTTVQPGESETIEFTAPEAGEYGFECTLHPGMEGTLVVEEG